MKTLAEYKPKVFCAFEKVDIEKELQEVNS